MDTKISRLDSKASADLLGVARCHARHLGLTVEDAEDCAAAFVEREWHHERVNDPCSAWQHTCAENFARDFRRALLRRGQHELCWGECARPGEPPAMLDLPDSVPGPENCLLRREFWREVRAVLKRVEPVPRKLFLRRTVRQWSISELAAWSGLTQHVVEQKLYRARKRLREILLRKGLTEAELRSYLAGTTLT